MYVYCFVLHSLSCIDHDRPLDEAGEADAIEVSRKLHQMGWIPELILCRLVAVVVSLLHNLFNVDFKLRGRTSCTH